MKNSVSRNLNCLTLNRALFAVALGVLATGFAEKASAGLIGHTHTVTLGGGTHDSSYEYGVDNASRGISAGSKSFESTGASGLNFFVYFADNPGSPGNLMTIGTSWGATNLAAAFPPAGLTEDLSIRALIPGSDRNSAIYNPLTHVAPNGGIFVESWNADSFTLGVPSGVSIPSGSIVGYEVTLEPSAVPEPSTLAMLLTGGVGLVAYRVRRKRKQS